MTITWLDFLPHFIRRTLDGRIQLQKVLGNTGWLLADKILRMAIGLIVGVWVVRFLGPDQFGVLSFAVAFATLFGVFGTLGLDGIIVRELVHDPKSMDEILGTAFLIKCIGGLAAFVFAAATIAMLRPSDSLTIWLVAITAGGFLFQSFDVIDYWFQSQVKAGAAVLARSAAFLIISITKLFLIFYKAPLIAFAWTASAEIAVAALGLLLAYRIKGFHLLGWRLDKKRLLAVLQQSWPLAIAGVSVIVYMKIDQVMLDEMLGNAAVGVYSAAVRISEVWYFIPAAIVASVSPSLIEAKKISSEIYYARLEKLFKTMAGIALLIAIPMTFLAGHITIALYGNAYAAAGPVLAVHIWAALFVFLGVAQGPWTIIEGHAKLALFRTSIGAVANVLLNLLLIPMFGIIGAAVATTVSYAISAVILNAFSTSTRRIFAMQLSAIVPLFPNH